MNTGATDAAIARAQQLQAVMRELSALTTGGSVPAAPSVGPRFGGPRAKGGRVRRGLSYLIGEEGPEVVTFGADGHVTPNHALQGGGAGGIHIGKVEIHGVNTDDAMAKLGQTLDRLLVRSRQTAIDGRQGFEFA